MKPATFIILQGTAFYRAKKNAISAANGEGCTLVFAGSPNDIVGAIFQNSAGTTPATGTDPIGYILDRSTNARPATMSVDIRRPTLEFQSSGYYSNRFSGTQYMGIATGLGADPTAETLIAAGRFTRAFGTAESIAGRRLGTNGIFIRREADGSYRAYANNGAGAFAAILMGTQSLATPVVLSMTAGTGGFSAWRNSELSGTNAAVYTSASAATPVGLGDYAGDALAQPFYGVGGLFAWAPREISASARIAIERLGMMLAAP